MPLRENLRDIYLYSQFSIRVKIEYVHATVNKFDFSNLKMRKSFSKSCSKFIALIKYLVEA